MRWEHTPGDLWKDGRTPMVLRIAGEAALARLGNGDERWHKGRGIIFLNSDRVVLGRTFDGRNIRSGDRMLHWCNLSLRQLREIEEYANGREVGYLLVTLSPCRAVVDMWDVPAGVMVKEVFSKPPKKTKGRDYDCRVVGDGTGRCFIGKEDVTAYHCAFRFTDEEMQYIRRCEQSRE